MSSREKILKEIAQNKPAAIPLPEKFSVARDNQNLVEKYLEVLRSIGGVGKVVSDFNEVQQLLQQKLQEGVEVVNAIESLSPHNIGTYANKEAAGVESVHTVFLEGKIAVAENAAIWLPERNMVNRVLPFICQHLVLVVEEKNVVADMHQAYDRITVGEEGYGAFIAGPSKTADIEQSLVIGAHGPLNLDVFILAKKLID